MISVIIPTYNRANLISRAIISVNNQTYRDIEIIVVDDASTDNTANIVRNLKIPNLKYIQLSQNKGACHARNVGIQHSIGEYISFLDSDDIWELTKLEEQYNFLLEKKASVVVCNYWKEKNGGKNIRISSHNEIITLKELLNANIITTGSLLVSRRVFEEVGVFDELMPRYQDWELALRIIKKFVIYFQNKPLLTLYFQENSITNSTSKAKKFFALERMIEKNQTEMIAYPKAYAHHCWSMGLYSMYMNDRRWDLLKKGIKIDGFNLRRFFIYVILKCGFVKLFKMQYSKNH